MLLAILVFVAVTGLVIGGYYAAIVMPPRMAKRRTRRYDDLTRPRAEIKLRMLK